MRRAMKLAFTKMHGLGNDFVVLDATRAPLALTRAQWRFIADRHFGVGADQILVVEAGRIAAQGDLQTLLETSPLFQEIWNETLRAHAHGEEAPEAYA